MKTTHFPFMEYSKHLIGVSVVTAVIGALLLATFGLRLGIDFTGGSLLEMSQLDNSHKPAIEAAVSSLGEEFQHSVMQSTSNGSMIIRTKFLTPEDHNILVQKIQAIAPGSTELRFNTIGASVGEVMKNKAIMAIVLCCLGIILYVAIAFSSLPKELSSLKFGVVSVVALLHDVIIVLGIFALLGHLFHVEVDAMFITAILTVMGFSVHDTIVVFDRFRENLLRNSDNRPVKDIANDALNQTLGRSINTSLTVILSLLALIFFAGNSIFYFVLALLIGITIGTYSSIFVATPLLSLWTGAETIVHLKKEKSDAEQGAADDINNRGSIWHS